MTSSTTASTEEQIDGALVDDKRVGKLLGKNLSKRTHNPNWSFTPKSRQVDDGKHWRPAPPPYRRGR